MSTTLSRMYKEDGAKTFVMLKYEDNLIWFCWHISKQEYRNSNRDILKHNKFVSVYSE